MSIGRQLRTYRQLAGWTQVSLSQQVGLSAEAYARIERGRALPSLPTLLRLGNALRLSSDALLGEAQQQIRDGVAVDRDGHALRPSLRSGTQTQNP